MSYIPKLIREILGDEFEFIINAESVVLIRKNANPERVLKSLNIVRQHVELTVEGEP